MLLRFKVSNHASVRTWQELSLIAGDGPAGDDQALSPVPGTDLHTLPVVSMFGANATGKSNLLGALAFMRDAVLESHQGWRPGQAVPRKPFALDPEDRRHPSVFVLELLLGEVRYEYGFALGDSAVEEEWLYSFPSGKQRVLFERDTTGVRYGPSFKGRRKLIEDTVRPNSLFVSAGALHNNPLLGQLYQWFRTGLSIASDANLGERMFVTSEAWKGDAQPLMRELLSYADLGVVDLELVVEPLAEDVHTGLIQFARAVTRDRFDERAFEGIRSFERVRLRHQGAVGSVTFDLDEESSGTRTWVGLLGSLTGALMTGGVLAVDELDARLHPLIAAKLVALFQRRTSNPRGAQLLFNSHDATLLAPHSEAGLRRDQVWLTEKGADGGTTLTALLDYRPRRDGAANLERGYLAGRYGGLPFFDDDLLDRFVEGLEGNRSAITAG